MSTIQVDRIIPYQSSSVTIEGDVTVLGAATTGSNTFTGDQNIQGTITASIAEGFALVGGVGNVSTLVATSSFGGALPEGVVSGSAQISSLGFATTGSNTFNGDQNVNGNVKQTFTAPSANTQVDIAQVNGANIDGQAYTNVFFGMQDYPGGGDQFKDAWIFDYWTDFTFATGSEFIVNPKRIGATMALSGSGLGSLGISQLRDLGGKTFLNQYANLISIGAYAPATTDQIVIGHDALPVLRLSSANTEMTGSVIISGSAGLRVNGGVIVTGSEAGVNTNISTLSTVITSGSNNSFLSAILFSNVDTSGGNVRLIGLYANPEKVNAALAGKVQPSLVGVNSSFAPYQVLELQSHGNYTDGTAGFKVPLEVTGSVSISSVLQLAGQDPLPAGGVGQLAVSSSGDLYYHNGVDWQLK